MPTPDPSPHLLAACTRTGTHYRTCAIAATATHYTRATHLRKLLAVTPEEIADGSAQGRRKVIARLLRLARNSARAGQRGHWSYDPNRHIAILGALQAERALLTALKSGAAKTRRETDRALDAPPEINT